MEAGIQRNDAAGSGDSKLSTLRRQVQVYDPAMCCATGVCGPSVDPVLPAFAAALDQIKHRGHSVFRFNLAQQPQAFIVEPQVRALLENEGNACLPLIIVDGQVVMKGGYPTEEELAALLG